MAMRWSKKDKAKLQSSINASNAKRKRLIAQGYDENLLPPHKTLKESMKKIGNNRKYFNDEIKINKAFTKRGSEEITRNKAHTKIPKYLIEVLDIQTKRINEVRKQERDYFKSLRKTDRNKVLDKFANVGIDEQLAQLNPIKNRLDWVTPKILQSIKENRENYTESIKEKQNNYVVNYYLALQNEYGNYWAKEIMKVMDKLELDEIIEKRYTDINMDINFIYSKSEIDSKAEETLKAWKRQLRKKKQKDRNIEETELDMRRSKLIDKLKERT